ncbi:hypothetical protein [Demequina pelophila]|uniref:hypothetical protein n=1 Tax=Demequina pelophila TaxID=1638984 RepID=UPI000784C176|nr:hypothetical protein [Demequina pelophila]
MSQAHARRGLPAAAIAVIVVGVAAVALLFGLGTWWLVTGDDAPVAEAGASPAASVSPSVAATAEATPDPSVAPSATPGPSASPDPSVSPDPEASATPAPEPSPVPTLEAGGTLAFQSPSGNIRCEVEDLDGFTWLLCQQPSINYDPPAQACDGDADGVAVGLWSDAAPEYPCLDDNLEGGEVLPLDTPAAIGALDCLLTLDEGLRCTNPQGRGFTLEYSRGIGFLP